MRGSIRDRPWGLTLGALGNERRAVELVLRSGDRTHTITFDQGLVVGATSPLAVDSALRVALTAHVVSSMRANQIKRAIAVAPMLDEVEVLGAAAQLTPDQIRGLRQRIILQRAARTFAIDDGDYELVERAPLATPPDFHVDIGAVIYTGVRMNLSDVRLAYDMRQLGTHFVLKPDAIDHLDRFGIGRQEAPIIDALIVGTNLPELEASFRDIDPRTTQSVLYALAACDALIETTPGGVRRRLGSPVRQTTGSLPIMREVVPKVAAPRLPAADDAVAPVSRQASRAQRQSEFDRSPSTEQKMFDALQMLERGEAMPDAEFKLPDATPHAGPLPDPPPGPPQSDLIVKFVESPRGIRIDTPPEIPAVPEPIGDEHSRETQLADPAVVAALLDPHSVDTRPVTITPGRVRTITPVPATESFEVATRLAPTSLVNELLSKAVPTEAERGSKPRSMIDSFRTGAMTTVRPNALSRSELLAFMTERAMMLDRGVDHFTLMGLPVAAPVEQVHAVYVEIARNLSPKRLAELGISDDGFHAARLLAQVGIAYTVLTDRVLRPEYIATLRRGQRSRTDR